MPCQKPTHSFLCHGFSFHKVGETALHSVSGIPPVRNNEDDHVNVVEILLEHGANLTYTTYQVMSHYLKKVIHVESKGNGILFFQN